MLRPDRGGRITGWVLGIGIVLSIAGVARPGQDSGSSARTEVPAPSTEDDIASFLRLLGRLRRGDESVLPEMRANAERLCEVHARCDGQAILEYYSGLTVEQRARGLDQEAKFRDIVQSVRARFRAGRLDEAWIELCDEAQEELRAIAGESLGGGGDLLPGAYALSFGARLETDRIIGDFAIDSDEREERIEAAREEALESIATFERCGMLTPKLEPMWLLGYLHAAEGEIALGRRNFEEALALARRLDRVDWQEEAIRGLVHLAKEVGDTSQVALLLDELSRVRDPDQSWFLVREQAILLLEEDLAEAAVQFLLAHVPGDDPSRREWHILLGSGLLRKGDLDAAREAYALAEPLPFGREVSLGMAAIDLGSGEADRVLTQLDRPEFLSGLHPFEECFALQLCGDAALRLGRHEEAAKHLERALRIGADVQARLRVERDLSGAATSVFGEGVGLQALALLAEARAALGQPLEAARAIESWQSRSLRPSGEKDLTAEQVLAWARSTGLGLVTWVVGADSSVVAHVASDGSAVAISLPRGRRSVQAAVRRLAEATVGGDPALSRRLAAKIAPEILPPPIRARIDVTASEDRRLLVLVHGPIERLPVEYLLRDDDIVPIVLPGLPSTEPGDPPPARALADWAILGGPLGDRGNQRLPGAREELTAVASLRASSPADDGDTTDVVAAARSESGPRLRIGPAFDRGALESALRGRRPVHVATHLREGCGRDEGRLADVGLELSGDDVLCAREILEIGPRLPLAVLSACETAEGRFVDAEGLQGVARAFLESGTRNLLVTLWPVEDGCARDFALAFHRALLAGERPSQAAATARERLREAGSPSADWAAFRLIGRD